MESIIEEMKNIIRKCDICIDGNTISQEMLLKTFCDFIHFTIGKEKHNVGIVLHTGSICFDAILLSYAALTDILYNKTNSNEIIYSLTPGDTVLFYKGDRGRGKAQRYIFKGFVDDPDDEPVSQSKHYVVLQQGRWDKTFVPIASWACIIPYWGNSSSMDGKGLRKENGKRNHFFNYVLGLKDADIPRIIDTSTVIVMPREKANYLINCLSFRFDDDCLKLSELVPISYYADGEHEYPYGGNPAKAEPVLKITGKVSVARKLLLQRNGNANIGLIVLGEESYRRGESEIPELLERQSLQYVYMCMHIDSEISLKLVEDNDSAEVFACTREFLLSNSIETIDHNPLTDQLAEQVDVIIDREISEIEVQSFIDWNEYKTFKRLMLYVKSADYSSDEKDDFVIQAYSLMNLFMTAIFSIQRLEIYIDTLKINNVEKPVKRLQRIKDNVQMLPEYLKEPASNIASILKNAYLKLYSESYKENALMQVLKDNLSHKICIVVPKAYYSVIISDAINNMFSKYASLIDIITVNQFDNTKLYELIIVAGNISGTSFDAVRCRSAKKIISILYNVEKYQYGRKIRKLNSTEHFLNQRSTILTEDEYEEYKTDYNDVEIKEIEEIEKIDYSLDGFVGSTLARNVRNNSVYSGNRAMAEIIAVTRFNSDEVAFFTKNYKAYVLTDADNSIKEVGVKELMEGDNIVFTRSNAKTRDIVEEILRELVKDNSLPSDIEEAYFKSREWKTVLTNYLSQNKKSAKQIADEMIENGVGVQENTIKSWLDENSHTVRPKKLSSIQQIALIANNDALFDSAQECYDAGSVIYRIRRQILKAIGQAILGEITGKNDPLNPYTESVSARIKDAAVVLRIESISFINDLVPINTINRPISID